MGNPFAVIRADDDAGRARLVVIGEIDIDVSDGLTEIIDNVVRGGPIRQLTVDLHYVTFLAASGVRALLAGERVAVAEGAAYRLVNAEGMVRQVLRITGLDRLLEAEDRGRVGRAGHG